MSRISKTVETESRLMVAWDCGTWKEWGVTLMGMGFWVGGKNSLEMMVEMVA